MSRSCHSATFSSAGITAARTSRASPVRFSARIGLCLCGIAELPFWPARERLGDLADLGALQVADLGRQPLDPARDHGERGEERGVPVARDHLGRDRLRRQPEPRRDALLDPRDRRWRTCRPRPRARRSRSRRAPAPGAAGCARTRRRTRRASGRTSSARRECRASARCTGVCLCSCARRSSASSTRSRSPSRRSAARASAAGRARCRAGRTRSCRGADSAPRRRSPARRG